MGEGIFNLISQFPLQTETEGNDLVCTYLIILAVILIALYLGLFIYNKMVIGKKAKQHPCKYCGHMVMAVSKCCGAPVEEKFMAGKCSKCGKDTNTICVSCKRDLY